MSFFKNLFGWGGSAATAEPFKTAEHKGFMVEATPYKAEGMWQLSGLIWKEIGGERKIHQFIRADRFNSKDEAADLAITKGRQIIDEQGEAIFKL